MIFCHFFMFALCLYRPQPVRQLGHFTEEVYTLEAAAVQTITILMRTNYNNEVSSGVLLHV